MYLAKINLWNFSSPQLDIQDMLSLFRMGLLRYQQEYFILFENLSLMVWEFILDLFRFVNLVIYHGLIACTKYHSTQYYGFK